MLYDVRITSAQTAALGRWVEPGLADVDLRVNDGVLEAEQGDQYALWAPDGTPVDYASKRELADGIRSEEQGLGADPLQNGEGA